MSVRVWQRNQTNLVIARVWKLRADFGVGLLCQRPVSTKPVQNRNGRPITSSHLCRGMTTTCCDPRRVSHIDAWVAGKPRLFKLIVIAEYVHVKYV